MRNVNNKKIELKNTSQIFYPNKDLTIKSLFKGLTKEQLEVLEISDSKMFNIENIDFNFKCKIETYVNDLEHSYYTNIVSIKNLKNNKIVEFNYTPTLKVYNYEFRLIDFSLMDLLKNKNIKENFEKIEEKTNYFNSKFKKEELILSDCFV